MSENKPFVAILMGSDSDLPVMRSTMEVLDKFSVAKEVKITSAHRTPEATKAYIKDAEARGCSVFIAAAGLAAHLAGAVAATTTKPVIGVPLDAGPLSGIDALLATVQMPGGIPVGTVAVGKAGAKNAAYLAAQILALQDADLAATITAEREQMTRDVQKKDAALQEQLAG